MSPKRGLASVVVALLGVTLVVAQQPPVKPGTPPQNPPGKTDPAGMQKPGTPPGKADVPKSTGEARESFYTWTFDGVRLDGDFYPAPEGRGKKTPVILLLHAVGKGRTNASRADFGKLPEKLQKQGYAVVAFDFRGYGKSKTITTDFWNYHQARTRTLDRLEAKDFTGPRDLLDLVNDVIAIKVWLNKKNNIGDCNSNHVGVIGVEQGALVGLVWLVNDLTDINRTKERRTVGNFGPGGFNAGAGGFGGNQFGNPPPGGVPPGMPRMEGEDVACFVAVSMSNRLSDVIPLALTERWLSYVRDKQVPIFALYGANDREAAGFWAKAGNWIKPSQDKTRYKNSKVQPVKGTNLAGTKLLLNDTLDLTKALEEYLSENVKKTSEAKLWTEQVNADRPTPVDINRLLR